MRLVVLVLITAITACHNPCDDADYTIDGLCVIENGFTNILPDDISWTIGETEWLVNRRFPGLNLPKLLENIPASLSYVSELPLNQPEKVNGVTLDEQDIYMEWEQSDTYTYSSCVVDQVVLLNHELLHIIAIKHVGASHEANKNHDVPGLFLPLDCENHSCPSVEGDMWIIGQNYCSRYHTTAE